MRSFFGLSERAEIHQVPEGHSSQQLMASAAMLLKEFTARNALRAGLFEGEAVVGEVGKATTNPNSSPGRHASRIHMVHHITPGNVGAKTSSQNVE